MPTQTLETRAIADAAMRLRQDTVALLDSLSEEEYGSLALPPREPGGVGWTVADVFRHLAETDRLSVLGAGLLSFLPGRERAEMEDQRDADLERLRDASRQQLREELITWGRRLQRIIALTPGLLARRTIPTMFGRVSIAWIAMLRVQDEWVHQDDVRRALHRGEIPPDADTRTLLAEFHLRALPAGPLRQRDGEGVVEVVFGDLLAWPAWRFDFGAHEYGATVVTEPTLRIESDVATWSRISADRLEWRDAEEAGMLTIDGEDRKAAERLLNAVRVV
jgi:hypothetical protein